jgi:MarR family transcriptional regulator, organic hydroperoxide resistance regulator
MGKTEMIREILFLQSEVDHIVKRFTAEPWIELKMTIAQLKSLFFIAEKGKTNFKKLADALGVTPPNITGIIDRLVEQGLVSRTENIEDRRVMLLQMTGKGLTLVNNLHENRFNNLNNLMINMTEDDLCSLMKGMKGILKANDDLGVNKSE